MRTIPEGVDAALCPNLSLVIQCQEGARSYQLWPLDGTVHCLPAAESAATVIWHWEGIKFGISVMSPGLEVVAGITIGSRAATSFFFKLNLNSLNFSECNLL